MPKFYIKASLVKLYGVEADTLEDAIEDVKSRDLTPFIRVYNMLDKTPVLPVDDLPEMKARANFKPNPEED